MNDVRKIAGLVQRTPRTQLARFKVIKKPKPAPRTQRKSLRGLFILFDEIPGGSYL
jgi:hypothetical protein